MQKRHTVQNQMSFLQYKISLIILLFVLQQKLKS